MASFRWWNRGKTLRTIAATSLHHPGLLTAVLVTFMSGATGELLREEQAAVHSDPAPYVFAEYPDCIPAAELLDLELFANGVAVPGTRPTITAGTRVDVRMRIVPRVASPAGLLVRIGIGNDAIRVNQVGPIETDQWSVGVASVLECSIRVPPFTFVGDGVLTIAIQEDRGPMDGDAARKTRVPEAIVYQGKIQVLPVTVDSTIDNAEIAEALGRESIRVGKAFRIAAGQAISIPLQTDRPVAEIVLIGAIPGDINRSERPQVLRAWVTTGAGQTEECRDSAGDSISLVRYDAFRPGARFLAVGDRFSSYPYPDRSWKNEPLLAYAYRARLPLRSTTTPRSLLVENISASTMLDIYDIVLLQGQGGK